VLAPWAPHALGRGRLTAPLIYTHTPPHTHTPSHTHTPTHTHCHSVVLPPGAIPTNATLGTAQAP